MEKQFCVYIMTSKPYGVLYIGVTSDLLKRVWQHQEGMIEGFTKRYHVKRLVYYEFHGNAESAITREKQLKAWKRAWKVDLIEQHNAEWADMFPALAGGYVEG